MKKSQKPFKYILKTKGGQIIAKEVVVFGDDDHPWPDEWKNDIYAQRAIQRCKEEFLYNHVMVEVEEVNLDSSCN